MSAPAITPENFWLWFGGIWLGIGAPFVAIATGLALDGALESRRLDRAGADAEGIVLVKELVSGDGGPSFRVTYRFAPAEGAPVTATADIDGATWDALAERGPVAVRYLPGRPGRHRIAGERREVLLPLLLGSLGGILAILGGFVLARALADRRAGRRLAEAGALATGTVTGLSTARVRIDGVRQRRVRFRFEDAGGTERRGATTISPERAEGLAEGDTGRVRYDPERPRRSRWLGGDAADGG